MNNTGKAVFLDFKYAIQQLGRDTIEKRYGNLFQMYEKITAVDPYENPMMIYPAIHYSMHLSFAAREATSRGTKFPNAG